MSDVKTVKLRTSDDFWGRVFPQHHIMQSLVSGLNLSPDDARLAAAAAAFQEHKDPAVLLGEFLPELNALGENAQAMLCRKLLGRSTYVPDGWPTLGRNI